MKKSLLFLVATLFAAATAFAQTDTAKVSKLYAGMLYAGSYDGLKLSHGGSIRVGAEASWEVLHLRAVYGSDNTMFAHFWAEQPLFSGLSVLVGNMPRMVSYQRPNPVTWAAHFELATTMIPGATGGAVLKETFDSSTTLYAGTYFNQGKKAIEYDWGVQKDAGSLHAELAMYTCQKTFGMAATLAWPALAVTAFRETDSLASVVAIGNLPFCSPYASLVYNHLHPDRLWEVGVTKDLATTYGITILIGAGYEYPTHLGKAYILIHN